MVVHPTRLALATAVVLGLATSGCGADEPARAAVSKALTECRAQWHDVATSVEGLDQDENPSGLASRWTSVLATVDYYETTETAKNCQQNITTQITAITQLRQVSSRLQPYDMEYQAKALAADVGRYLADPLPAARRSKAGKLDAPPSKAVVQTALNTLEGNAASANEELKPGWGQLASVELTDAAAVDTAIQDLEFLAKDSASWVRCRTALSVLAAAIRAQHGLGPDDPLPESVPTPTATP